jgi:hypothetical protein
MPKNIEYKLSRFAGEPARSKINDEEIILGKCEIYPTESLPSRLTGNFPEALNDYALNTEAY